MRMDSVQSVTGRRHKVGRKPRAPARGCRDCERCPRPHGRGFPECSRRAGMTLIELLVSLGVLAMISIAFATIMSQSQRVVDKSNALMRSNATASAIAQTLRDDLACLSSEGFLYVKKDTVNGQDQFKLVFLSVGPFISRADPNVRANAARIEYGWCNNGTVDDYRDDFVWRRAILLTGTGSADESVYDPNAGNDVDPNMWLGAYGPILAADPNSLPLDRYCADPSPIPLTPTSPADAGLWPMLARPVSRFRVSWWANDKWNEPDAAGTTIAGPTLPTAIRVDFSIWTGPKKDDGLDYEVVCPIRR